ncbi:MAG: bifunctional (p)ppGpp synthetase/guanosine-3',5'-bis(diphosphate) 3'-pyrophosphohydrolase [Candidatus Aenigmarchaeota archaeon]|nr:bifunctional (p)ppGpp synthetase/guanosine-3',5'-bis(diphosphate) 3'-pyrophosphohydrolase [Candidatus Aenigmarchaeota archaeon]
MSVVNDQIYNIKKVRDSMRFALICHDGQTRKDGITPSVVHPLRIFAILATKLKIDDPEILAAALLHDTIEDTQTDYDEISGRFGENVANYVSGLSIDSRLSKDQRHAEYLSRLKTQPWQVKIIRLADMYDNSFDAKHLKDPIRWIDKKKDEIKIIEKDIPSQYKYFLEEVHQNLENCLN